MHKIEEVKQPVQLKMPYPSLFCDSK